MIPHHSTHATQLLNYIEQGVTPAECARALGITPSAVTQLMDSPELRDKIASIREEQLKRSSALDVAYDRVEEKLLNQFEQTVPMLLKPEQIVNALEKINRMKRRGIAMTTPEAPAKVVHLHLPTQVLAKFTTNVNNQVVAVGGQELITIQSANVAKLAEAKHAIPAAPQQEKLDEFGFVTKG